MTKRAEFLPELDIVVDLAVEDDDHAAIFIRDRLPPTGNIDDAQPAHAECELAIDIHALIIRPAMADYTQHASESFRRNWLLIGVAEGTANAAHEMDSPDYSLFGAARSNMSI